MFEVFKTASFRPLSWACTCVHTFRKIILIPLSVWNCVGETYSSLHSRQLAWKHKFKFHLFSVTPVTRSIKILLKCWNCNCFDQEIQNNGMGKIFFRSGIYRYTLKGAYTKTLVIQREISFLGSSTVIGLTTFKCLILLKQ